MDVEYLAIEPRELVLERRHLADASRPAEKLTDEFDALIADMEADGAEAHQDRAHALLDECESLPDPRADEPDELEAIRAARPSGPRRLDVTDDERTDRIAGAWVGRLAGCLLGKPVETWTRTEIRRFLDATDQALDGYLRANVSGSNGFDLDETGGWIDRVDGTVRDDDVDFTVAALETLRRAGPDFTSEDLAWTWLTQLPAGKLHTAERVAYRNLLDGIDPPESATRRNPYRELIGAQIRGDCYGYVAPGNPELAAALAYRDARVSHVRNGIYGAMWVAATLAAVPAVETLRSALEIGLTEIPADSRFADAVTTVLSWRDDEVDFATAIDRIHDGWDDGDYYEGYHVLPNAQVVAAVLAWPGSDLDFGTAISRAVGAGFDTDCNGATVGSAVGLHVGRDALPDAWVDPLGDRARTALADQPCPSIEWLTAETVTLVDQVV
ncbi:ADP-ribosylglycohydrolase family protein [Halegenticoccus soli]|uniref:ADP-ribosylglycohydrolase family protein n=1 Tax=Halegenticoccus soli TaxID=1985678 RepID=UPI0013046FBA|nr:ADP-ribosylglycohydrolase family protein [Halegenticoccus soli]